MSEFWQLLARGDPFFALKAGTVVLLAILVRRSRKAWLATVLLTALLIGLDVVADQPPVRLLLHALIYLVLSAAIFWAIDRMPNHLLAGAIAAGGIMALTWFV